MLALGYEEYGELLVADFLRSTYFVLLVYQGGDWGHSVRLHLSST